MTVCQRVQLFLYGGRDLAVAVPNAAHSRPGRGVEKPLPVIEKNVAALAADGLSGQNVSAAVEDRCCLLRNRCGSGVAIILHRPYHQNLSNL